jgi:hypothetical protein
MRGTLAEFTITQLLQLFALSERSGTIMINGSERRCRLFVAGDRVIGLGLPEFDVRSEILSCELLPPSTRAMIEGITPRPEVPGLSFVVSNALEPERWETFVQRQIEQQLFPVLNLDHGEFEIVVGRCPPAPVRLSISIQHLILEGSRWEAEIDDLTREGFRLDSSWQRGDLGGLISGVRIANVDWLVWSALERASTIAEIARRTCLPDLLTATAIKRMSADGIVRSATTEPDAERRTMRGAK